MKAIWKTRARKIQENAFGAQNWDLKDVIKSVQTRSVFELYYTILY